MKYAIVALQNANDADEDAIRVINREVGWHKLLQIKPNLEAMVENADTSPLATAAEQYANVRKFAGVFYRIACRSAILGHLRKS